jgi:hypothetical protein
MFRISHIQKTKLIKNTTNSNIFNDMIILNTTDKRHPQTLTLVQHIDCEFSHSLAGGRRESKYSKI